MPTWDKSSTWLDASINLGAANTWSAIQTFSAGLTVSGGNLIAPTIIGGTGTTSKLTLQPTSGVGTTGADIVFMVGNNGATEAMRVLNNGTVSIGGTGSTALAGDVLRIAQPGLPNFYVRLGSTNTANSDVILQIFNGDLRVRVGADFGGGSGSIMTVFTTAGFLGLGGSGTAASLLDLRAGDLTFSGANGQKYVQGRATEFVSVGSGLTTKATTIQIPADAVVDAVPVYVKTKPGGTSTMTVTSTTSGTVFQKGASISTNAGTSDPGNKNTPANYNSVAAQTVTFTFNAPTSDALGEIRVDFYYHVPTPPTS